MEAIDNFFYEENFYFEATTAINDDRLTRAIIKCEEMYSENHYLTENDKRSLVSKVRDFFNKLINIISTFMKKIQLKIDDFIRSNKVDLDLISKKSYLEDLKKKGKTHIITMDFNKCKNIYLNAVDELWESVERMTKLKYDNGDQIEQDIENFKKILKKWDEKLEEVYQIKITVPIDQALKFVDNELHNKSQVFQTIRECETKLKEIQIKVESVESLYNASGDNIIPKKVNMLKKVCNNITNFIRKHVAKILAVIIFICAF